MLTECNDDYYAEMASAGFYLNNFDQVLICLGKIQNVIDYHSSFVCLARSYAGRGEGDKVEKVLDCFHEKYNLPSLDKQNHLIDICNYAATSAAGHGYKNLALNLFMHKYNTGPNYNLAAINLARYNGSTRDIIFYLEKSTVRIQISKVITELQKQGQIQKSNEINDYFLKKGMVQDFIQVVEPIATSDREDGTNNTLRRFSVQEPIRTFPREQPDRTRKSTLPRTKYDEHKAERKEIRPRN